MRPDVLRNAKCGVDRRCRKWLSPWYWRLHHTSKYKDGLAVALLSELSTASPLPSTLPCVRVVAVLAGAPRTLGPSGYED